ncbi:hypothetical protein M3J09_002084 [Ascochyta lentis]
MAYAPPLPPTLLVMITCADACPLRDLHLETGVSPAPRRIPSGSSAEKGVQALRRARAV